MTHPRELAIDQITSPELLGFFSRRAPDLFRTAAKHIAAYPRLHDQRTWHTGRSICLDDVDDLQPVVETDADGMVVDWCNTTCCTAGWIALDMGYRLGHDFDEDEFSDDDFGDDEFGDDEFGDGCLELVFRGLFNTSRLNPVPYGLEMAIFGEAADRPLIDGPDGLEHSEVAVSKVEWADALVCLGERIDTHQLTPQPTISASPSKVRFQDEWVVLSFAARPEWVWSVKAPR